MIPAKREPTRSRVPTRRFHYDERNDIVKCSRGKVLHPGQPFMGRRRFHVSTKVCAGCPLRGDCVAWSQNRKTTVITPTIRRCCAPGGGAFNGTKRITALRAPPLAIGRVPRRGQDLARAAPRRAARHNRQHENPVLPDGRRDQSEAARGRFLRPILRHRHDSNARNAPFRAPSAAARARPPHARPFRPAPRGKIPLRPPPRYTPESSEGRVIQRPLPPETWRFAWAGDLTDQQHCRP